MAKDPKSPVAAWKLGDQVNFRALTEPMDEGLLKYLYRNLESRNPPNKFKVLKTFAE